MNRGAYRDNWDALFHYADGAFARLPLVPVVGNHELYGDFPGLYLEQLHLPHNGPQGVTPERVYSFEYGQALFVMLDSNLPVEAQADWLEKTLAASDATWKFVAYHHPAYSSKASRDNPDVREVWGAIFDKYDVDVVFQGHDHGYLRTYPMKAGQRAKDPGDGTVYLVTVAGTKLYDVAERDYAAASMEKTPTFQIVDIQVRNDRLVYRAYNVDGDKLDEFIIEK